MELYDKDAEAKDARPLFSDILDVHVRREYKRGVELKGVKRDRLYVRLTALDGTEQNHAKAVFRGVSV